MSCRCFRYLHSSWTLALSVSLARALQGVPSVRDPGNLYDRDEQYVLSKAQRQERAPVRLLLNPGGRHFSSFCHPLTRDDAHYGRRGKCLLGRRDASNDFTVVQRRSAARNKHVRPS